MRVIFQEKGKKGQNIRKFGQKFTKIENILEKGSLMHAPIPCMKQLEFALTVESFSVGWYQHKSY